MQKRICYDIVLRPKANHFVIGALLHGLLVIRCVYQSSDSPVIIKETIATEQETSDVPWMLNRQVAVTFDGHMGKVFLRIITTGLMKGGCHI